MVIARIVIGLALPMLCLLPMFLFGGVLGALSAEKFSDKIFGVAVLGSAFLASVAYIGFLAWIVITGTYLT